ncbi:MAG TPA: LUD domain-containing protein, partial [Acidobacteriaceae bacterium]
LADAARHFLREKFLRVRTAVGGANFLVAETGSVVVVESEGNGRMCLTLPGTLITVAGIDKVIPRYQDLEVLLQLLPRSATGERMNPYTSVWAGVRVGDGPQSFHVVLLDNGRTDVLADAPARQTLHCIRCGACQNACPVYQQTGGHAYGSVYAGPIGAILTPQLQQMQHGRSLPFASTLCGACYEVCPVKINIPEVLLHLRHRVVAQSSSLSPEALAMRLAGAVFRRERRFRAAQRLARMVQRPLVQADTRDAAGHELKPARPLADELWIRWLPGVLAGWTSRRDLPAIPAQSFREWFQSRSAVSRAENRTDAKPNPASSGEGHRP